MTYHNKISEGQFNSLEDFKKAYFKEVKEKASHGLTTVTIDGTSVSSYDDLLALFKAAVAKDAASLKTDNNGNKICVNKPYDKTQRSCL